MTFSKAVRKMNFLTFKIIYAALFVVALGICAKWGSTAQLVVIVLVWLASAAILRSFEHRAPR